MSSSAERMKRTRYRRAMGIRVVPIEVSVDAAEVLVEMEYIAPNEVRDGEKLAAALSRFVEDQSEGVARHGVTLDCW